MEVLEPQKEGEVKVLIVAYETVLAISKQGHWWVMAEPRKGQTDWLGLKLGQMVDHGSPSLSLVPSGKRTDKRDRPLVC